MAFNFLQTSAQTQNYLTTSGNKLFDSSGKEVRLTGVNWFGFETSLYSPHGIWTRDMKSVLQQIKDLGFNTIRVPWCNEMLNPGASVNVASFGTDGYSGISPMNEEEATATTPIELLDIFVNWCQENDMKIVLDNHSRAADGFLNEAYWYTEEYSEERWINDWVFLAERYKGISAVVAMDLNNEPHGSTWGNSNPSTDWNKAAERCGNAVLAVNPDVLIIIEGVGEFEGDSYWWGGQLMGAEKYPIELSTPEKLVYSAHEYGPEVSQQDWFETADFPNNMPGIWDEHYNYLYENNTSPLFIGEFGIRNQDAANGIAYTWFTEFMDFIGSRYSWTFWTMNPNSGDTGGILQDDWVNVNQWKLDVLLPHISEVIPNVIGDTPDNNPPVANFTGFNEPCGENPSIAFLNASSSIDPDGDSLTYTWSVNGEVFGDGISLSYDFSDFNSNEVSVTLTVNDGEFSVSQTNDVLLYPGACPRSNIDTLEINTSDTSGTAPLTIDFEAVVTLLYGSENDVNYTWDFGNNSSGFGKETSTTYPEIGEYLVTLTGEAFENTVTATITIIVTPSTPFESDLSINYRNAGNSSTDNSINPHFEIVNNGVNTVDYSDLSIRYWFTSEDNNALNFWCDWAQIGTSSVLGNFGQENGMDYLEVTFPNTSSLSGNSNSGAIQTRFAKTNWSNFNENDDYSFDDSKTSFSSHEQVTLYQNGNLVWGTEPSNNAKTSNTNLISFKTFPNPAIETVTIQNETSLEDVIITIADFSGQQIKSIKPDTTMKNFRLNISDINPGVYIIKVNNKTESYSQLLMIK